MTSTGSVCSSDVLCCSVKLRHMVKSAHKLISLITNVSLGQPALSRHSTSSSNWSIPHISLATPRKGAICLLWSKRDVRTNADVVLKNQKRFCKRSCFCTTIAIDHLSCQTIDHALHRLCPRAVLPDQRVVVREDAAHSSKPPAGIAAP